MTDDSIVLNETIHQSTRLRIMTLLVSQPRRIGSPMGSFRRRWD